MKKRALLLSVLLLVMLPVSLLAGITIGSVGVDLFNPSSTDMFIVWQLRLPRVLLAALTGAMLAVSGALLQSSLRNPLCDPYILGVSSGGGLAAAAGIMIGLPVFAVSAFAFAGALLAVLAVFQISNISGEARPQTLILAGVAVSTFLGALIIFLVIFSDSLQPVYFWMLGSFSGATYAHVRIAAFCAGFGILISWFFSSRLNILSLRDEEALSLGVEVQTARIVFLALSSLMAGVAVSLCGMIGFAGLIIPHIIRLISGANNVYLIPLSALLGAVFMVTADIISRTILIPAEIPVGIITALAGAPFFIYLLRKRGG